MDSNFLSVICRPSCSHSHSNWAATSVAVSQSKDPQSARHRETQTEEGKRRRERVREESGVCGALFPHCVSDRARVRECVC